MTTIDSAVRTASQLAADLARPASGMRPVTFGRLIRVEARKLVDTRAGRWLVAVCALASAVTAWAAIVWMPDLDVANVPMFLLDLAITPVSVLVPVIAILTATAEWSQRTALTTFTLEPRRMRVVAAKAIVSCGAGVIAVAATLALVMAALGVAALLGDAPASWALDGTRLAGTTLVIVLGMLQASAFGFALLNSAAAIVSYFVLPTVMVMATTLSSRFAEYSAWFDIGSAGTPFLSGQVTDTDWAHLASAAAIWIVLPMAIGAARVLRSDLK